MRLIRSWKQSEKGERVPDKTTPLADTRKQESRWVHSRYFSAIDVCHDWHIRPSEFGLCEPDDDFAVMTAYTSTVADINSYEPPKKAKA